MGVQERIADWLQIVKERLGSFAKEIIKDTFTRVITSTIAGAVSAIILQLFQFPGSLWGRSPSTRPITSVSDDTTTTELPVAESTGTPLAEETVVEVTTETSPPMATQFLNEQFFLLFALLSILFLAFFSIRARQ